jgi:glycosyltransferase involved in cell wall biosynthesis
VGRLVEKKGFDVLVEACERLDAWDCPFHCTVIGDGPLRSSLEARARQHNLAHRITFRGAQSNETVLRAMQQHHVLVVPSRPARDGTRDGIPTVLLEALSYGRTVVASRFAGIPELVEDGETGRLVPPNDPSELAHALRDLFRHPDRASSMAAAGRDRVRRHFNLTREVGKLARLIKHHSPDSFQPSSPASANRSV